MSRYIYENQNSKAFYALAWISFLLAFVGMSIGLIYMEVELAVKGFLGIAYLFSVTACFTLAKVVRDRHEAEKFINKVESAKTEKFLSENSSVVKSPIL
ncbi:MAG: YiaA/YiaB family inner membrane protein [Bacteroidota bacterium]